MKLLFSGEHRVNERGIFLDGEILEGDFFEFSTFYNWDSLLEEKLAHSAKNKTGVEFEFERDGQKYLLKVAFQDGKVRQLSYDIYEIPCNSVA